MKYPGLLKNACTIDTYRPWNYQAYVRIANVWLRDQKWGVRNTKNVRCTVALHIPWILKTYCKLYCKLIFVQSAVFAKDSCYFFTHKKHISYLAVPLLLIAFTMMIIFFLLKTLRQWVSKCWYAFAYRERKSSGLWLAFLLLVDHNSVAPNPYVGPDPADQSCDGLHPHVGTGRDRASVL